MNVFIHFLKIYSGCKDWRKKVIQLKSKKERKKDERKKESKKERKKDKKTRVISGRFLIKLRFYLRNQLWTFSKDSYTRRILMLVEETKKKLFISQDFWEHKGTMSEHSFRGIGSVLQKWKIDKTIRWPIKLG